jgi:hypothetical protein
MIQEIFDRLCAYAPDGKIEDERDATSVKGGIERLLDAGWTPDEIVSHLRWVENVNPVTEEDVALRHLRRTQEAVEQRLAAKK